MQFIDLKKQYQLHQSAIDEKIKNVLAHGQYIMGPEVAELEARLAAYVGIKHCVTVASGTDALQLALMSLGIGPGDEIITTPFSFFATAGTILLLGARPVLVDIDEQTYNINPKLIEQAITEKTKAILPVSLYGQCADYDEINQIAQKYQLPVIEDGAQSFGATYKQRKSCSLTTLACTSFFPSKPLGCYGDGGACFTDDDAIADTLKQLRNHGQQQRYQHERVGINSRLDSIQAAVLLAKLDNFDQEIELRQQVAKHYSEHLAQHCKTPYIKSENQSCYAQYTIELDNREHVQQKLQENNIPTAVHYPIPLHKQPALQSKLSASISLPIAEACAKRVMSLPMHPFLEKKVIQEVAMNVIQALRG